MLNNSFEELERKYKKYYRKVLFKRFFRFFLFVAVAGGALFFYLFKWEDIKRFAASEFLKSGEGERNSTVSKKAPSPSLSLSPKIEVEKLKNFIENSDKSEVKVKRLPKTKSLPKEIYKRSSKKLSKEGELKEIKIKDEKTLKKEFVLYNDYKSAISLSKLFFERKKYKKAVKWAIKASRYNPGADEPWLIYAKVKKSEGRVELAVKALKTYLKSHKSERARRLLKKYEREGKKR